ncbi:MAG: hypothetical protein Q4F31_03830 [Eubacteriales bacterium]|nr:hypothetical protein [Eubacteriales bacterium]
MKKKLLLFFLIVVWMISFLLCSCGKSGGTKSPAEMTTEEKIAVAGKAIGGQYSELEAVIGSAADSRHAARCGTDGEDYEYFYDGFSILTYKEGDSEIVEEVDTAK